MEEEKKLKFSTFILKCIEFEKNPEDSAKLDEIHDFLDQLQIRAYIPLKEKELLATGIITSVSDDYDAPGAAVMIEMGKISKGLLSYCVNMENDIPYSNLLYNTYDKVFMYGLYDKILEYCEKDYLRFNALIDNMINVSNLYRIVHTAEFFDDTSYENWKESLNDLKETLDSDSIKELINLTGSNDGITDEIVKMIKESSLESANKKMQQEEKTTEKIVNKLNDKEENEEENEDGKEEVN